MSPDTLPDAAAADAAESTDAAEPTDAAGAVVGVSAAPRSQRHGDVPPALELRDVHVSYGGMRALSGLSLVVPPGAVVALLGPNGAGKSTTLRTVSGLVRADRGSISVHGYRVERRAAHAIARLGVVHVPEGRGIFPSLSVQENLEMAAYSVDATVDPVDGATGIFPVLGSRLRQLAGSLSGVAPEEDVPRYNARSRAKR